MGLDDQDRDITLLEFAEVAAFLGIGKRELRRAVRQKQVQALRIGWRWYFPESELIAYRERHLTPMPGEAEEAPGDAPSDDAAAPPDGDRANEELVRALADLGPPPAGDEEPVCLVEQAPIIRLANAIIVRAVHSGASDIHLEPDRKALLVRFRIHGTLREAVFIPKHIESPLLYRLMIMADLNIASGGVPQVGTIPLRIEKREYTLRVTCVPTDRGKSLAIRILDPSLLYRSLGRLGIPPEVEAQVEDLVLRPGGLFLVAGPPSSGKTTTLCALLHRLNSVERKIFTVEDPVEYPLPGITQVRVNRRMGVEVGNVLPWLLRQDPSLLVVGELRDPATARAAVEAAQEGSPVLSTRNAPDALGALERLMGGGVAPSRIEETLTGVLAQRLVRTICPACREPYSVAARELRGFGFVAEEDQEITLFRGRGCDACEQTGYQGRVGVFELLRINEEIAVLVRQNAPHREIRKAVRRGGRESLVEDGLRKLRDGVTSLEELPRAAPV